MEGRVRGQGSGLLPKSEMIGEAEIGGHFSSWHNNGTTRLSTSQDCLKNSQEFQKKHTKQRRAFLKSENHLCDLGGSTDNEAGCPAVTILNGKGSLPGGIICNLLIYYAAF